jgi:hypothetical protein
MRERKGTTTAANLTKLERHQAEEGQAEADAVSVELERSPPEKLPPVLLLIIFRSVIMNTNMH